jgi:hypothetical protein
MNFLFHTIIYFDNVPVYYNVHRVKDGYFVEIQDNPAKIQSAADFHLRREYDAWVSSSNIDGSILQALGEQIVSLYPVDII